MCLGIPMQVVESHPFQALCRNGGQFQSIDTALVGQQPVGAWLLVFLGSAREVLDAEQAQAIRAALSAVSVVMAGEAHNIDYLFADLSGREPPLPPHLAPLQRNQNE